MRSFFIFILKEFNINFIFSQQMTLILKERSQILNLKYHDNINQFYLLYTKSIIYLIVSKFAI